MKFILLLIAFSGDSVTTISNNISNVTTMEQCEVIGEKVAASMRKQSDEVHFICHEIQR